MPDSPQQPTPKLYVFADESATNSPDEQTFVVAIVACDSEALEKLENAVEALERASGRLTRKWKNSGDRRESRRLTYLAGLPKLAQLAGPFYWRPHEDRLQADVKTAETVVAAVKLRDPEDVTRRVIVIDALTKVSRDRMTVVFKHQDLHRREIREEARDAAGPVLRLADSLAGFLRHVHVGEAYAVAAWPKYQKLFVRVSSRLTMGYQNGILMMHSLEHVPVEPWRR
ncbi:MAG TPA: hypothetical protein VGO93_23940 [Candidatus Xenobia bacterium]|jgi:hypothetical protein